MDKLITQNLHQQNALHKTIQTVSELQSRPTNIRPNTIKIQVNKKPKILHDDALKNAQCSSKTAAPVLAYQSFSQHPLIHRIFDQLQIDQVESDREITRSKILCDCPKLQ